MPFSQRDYSHYSLMHDTFSADYHEINQYILQLYHRPKQFIDETSAPLDRFLREYTVPGAPRKAEVPTHTVLDFISQMDEFTTHAAGLFSEHKAHVDMCANYMQKVTLLKEIEKGKHDEEIRLNYLELAPELVQVHEGLRKIKEKADSMAERLENLQNRWAGIKGAIKP
jgi:hypothetical protein